jgi:hypothetical protein
MLALPDVFDLFMDEFPSLRGRGFPFACILACSFECLLFRHETSFVYTGTATGCLAIWLPDLPGEVGTSSASSEV